MLKRIYNLYKNKDMEEVLNKLSLRDIGFDEINNIIKKYAKSNIYTSIENNV